LITIFSVFLFRSAERRKTGSIEPEMVSQTSETIRA
jgi:hypothetical protein